MRQMTKSHHFLTAFRGSAWTIVGYGGSQLVRLASMLILARHLLGPSAFGLVALVNVFLSGLSLFSDLGVGADVIQHPCGDEPRFINTAFLLQAGRGIILWILASALAYPFALFYKQPAIFAMALVAAASVALQGFASGNVWVLTRHVRLKSVTLLRVGAEVIGLGVSIAWAVASPTAWALVAGRVAAEGFFTCGSHFIGDQRVSMLWDSSAAKQILAFGAGILASSATYFLAGEAERLVVGKFVSLVVLGCFSLALSITSAVTQALKQLLSQVFYPMIASSVRRDLDVAAAQFRKVRLILLAVSSCLAIGFITGGNLAVRILLGPKYAMAGWMVQLLGFRAALEIFTTGTMQMLFALGTSRYAAISNLVKLTFLAAGLFVAFGWFGVREAIWVLVLSSTIAYVPVLFGVKNKLSAALPSEMITFSAFLGISVLAAITMRVFV
jgi:O-antigen/teichoic acid export membrane protein